MTPVDAPPIRTGLLAAGNFIVDHVKVIDAFPEQDMLVNIVSETVSNGGGPYNVLKNLAKLGAPFPLSAAGLVGDDDDGQRIRDDCAAHGIGTEGLKTSSAQTSYTDAMTVSGTGRRTFFHHRGANALLSADAIDLSRSSAKIFYLGYLMLLDALDALDEAGCSGASRLLSAATGAGFTTVVDLVSISSPGYRESVAPSLPHVDFLFLNEREAALVLGVEAIRSEEDAAREVLGLGVRQAVVLHTAEGATAAISDGRVLRRKALPVAPGEVAGATGAGDAFSAGFLYALHEGSPLEEALGLAIAAAAASLRAPDPSSAILAAPECLAWAERLRAPADA